MGYCYKISKFEKDKNEWYQQALKNKTIDYWNFNCFLKPKETPVLAIRAGSLGKYKGYKVLARNNGLLLITPNKTKAKKKITKKTSKKK